MKQLLRTFAAALCLSILCMIGAPVCAQAAVKAPSKVTGLTATSGESYVTLRWKRVANATGYTVYSLDKDKNTLDKVATTKNNTITIKKLKNGTAYTFCVGAYRTVKSQKYYGKNSAYVTKTPNIKKPPVPKLQIKSCGDEKITLKWNKVSGANSYELFQKDAKGKYISIGTTSKTSVVVTKLTNGKSYQFKLRATRKVGGVSRSSNLSAAITARPVKITKAISSVHSMYYNAKVLRTVKAKRVDNKSKSVTVKAGTNVTVTQKTNGNCKVKLKNGTEVYISRSNLNLKSFKYDSKKDFSTAAKEGYVNHKGYRSDTKYLIWISLYRQRFYIFKGSQCNWKLYKTYKCSTGNMYSRDEDGKLCPTATPPGTYKLWKKAPKMFFDEYSYGLNVSYFSGNAIHSWMYVINHNGPDYFWGNPKTGLGHPASHGCVRLSLENSRFVYNNIPLSTTIVIY